MRVARASFPKGSRYMRLRDEFGAVFDDSRFAGLFPARGRPAEASVVQGSAGWPFGVEGWLA